VAVGGGGGGAALEGGVLEEVPQEGEGEHLVRRRRLRVPRHLQRHLHRQQQPGGTPRQPGAYDGESSLKSQTKPFVKWLGTKIKASPRQRMVLGMCV